MSFAAIIGQTEVKKRLGAALAGNPGHAYILIGPRGIGRRTMARAFAKALLCHNRIGQDACDQCPACRYWNAGSHPDYRILELAGKEKVIPVERVRQAVCADINLRPQFGPRKVYLITADDLNEQGQNALLKSLEEPPDYAVFLLTARDPAHLLPTIVSRSSLIRLSRLQPAEIGRILTAAGLDQAGDAAFCARFAGGVPGVALDLARQDWFGELRRETLAFYSQLPQASRAFLLTGGYAFFEGNRAHITDLLAILGSLIRDQLLLLTGGDQALLANPDQLTSLSELIKPYRSAADGRTRLIRAHSAILAARRGLELNASFEGLACNLLLVLRKELSYA
jgi:DNA polymerase-3 subunit delta'